MDKLKNLKYWIIVMIVITIAGAFTLMVKKIYEKQKENEPTIMMED